MDNKERMNLYHLIEQANKECKTSPIKDKPYIEVNERIKAFRKVYPDGFILTELVSNENGVCTFRATVGVYTENNEPLAIGTGTAYEKENSTFINKTSYIENCETSAVGRALGMAGFGIDASVASAEEVQNAINNQEQKPKEGAKATPEQVKILSEKYTDENLEKLLKAQGVTKIEDITAVKASEIITALRKRGML